MGVTSESPTIVSGRSVLPSHGEPRPKTTGHFETHWLDGTHGLGTGRVPARMADTHALDTILKTDRGMRFQEPRTPGRSAR